MDLNQNSSADSDVYEYPTWIGHKLLSDDLPWKQSDNLSFEQFHQGYSLHDSAWIGIFHKGFTQTVTLAIAWDAVWLPERLKQDVPRGVYLFIRLSQVTEISTLQQNDEISAFNCIFGSEDTAIDGARLLSIDILGGTVYITYQGDSPLFLAITDDERVLALSTPDETIA
jgi:hypothetical protein